MPRQDPAITATLMAQATKRIGIVPTFATFTHPPYLLARMVASLDQVSAGRIGWNMVTGSSDVAAQNLRPAGAARARPALRHGRRVHAGGATGCGTRWEPGAIVADRESGMLVDHTKVHAVDFEGQVLAPAGR